VGDRRLLAAGGVGIKSGDISEQRAIWRRMPRNRRIIDSLTSVSVGCYFPGVPAAMPLSQQRKSMRPLVSFPLIAVVALTSLSYAAGSVISFVFFNASSGGAVLFPPAGVSFAALALTSRRHWVWVIAAVAVTELAVDLSQGQSLRVVWGFVLANTIEPLVGAGLFRRHSDKFDLGRRRDLLAFVTFGVLVGPFVGALIGGTTIAVGFNQQWLGAVLPFWAGDGLGVLAVGGMILTVRPPIHENRPTSCSVIATLGIILTTVAGFWPTSVPLIYLPVPVMCFLAFWGGSFLVMTAGLALALTANVMSANGHGPWGEVGPTARLGIATLQLFVAITLISSWVLAVEVAEHQRSRALADRESRAQENERITARLARAVTSEDICRTIVRHGIELIAEHGVAGVLSADGSELQTWTTAKFPSAVATKYHRLPMSAVSQITEAARNGGIEIADNRNDLEHAFPETIESYMATGTHSCLSVPARCRDKIVGALAFGFDREGAIDPKVVAFAQRLGDLAGQALDRARRYEVEYETAHQLQDALLPAIDTSLVATATVAARYRPASAHHEIGGDWYDLFALPHDRIGFTVGDIVGHGLTAAVAMTRVQSALRIVASKGSCPSAVLEQLDNTIASIPEAFMTTIVHGDYDPSSRLLRYASAGHMPLLLCTEHDTAFLWAGRSVPLGVTTSERPQAELTVPHGAVLIGFTDGLVERPGEPIDVGLEELAKLARDLDQNSNLEIWSDSTIARMVGADARDDTALLCIRFDH
jgi:integral membrane sensor domain MASE1